MKVLVYGAGVIGCYLTHVLCEAGNDVTLLVSWCAGLKLCIGYMTVKNSGRVCGRS